MEVDKSRDRVQQMFGEIAPRYDLLNHLLSANVDRYWRWRTVRLASPEGEGPVLDVCTGTGDLALAYRRRAAAGVRVVGTDFCVNMLRIAERKRGQARAGGMQFLAADTLALPFGDEQFQLVSVAFGLRNVADTDAGLCEMARVCRPGGKVVILEFSMPRRQPLRFLYGWYFRHVLPRIGQLVARNKQQAYHYLPASVGQFPCGEALAQRMRASGLQDVTFWPFTFGVATLYVGRKPVTAHTHQQTLRRHSEPQAV